MRKIFHWVMVGVFLVGLVGCGGGSDSSSAPEETAVGSISGTISISNVFLPAQAAAVSVSSNQEGEEPQDLSSSNAPSNFVPGEIILEFKPGIDPVSALADLVKRYVDVQLSDAGTLYPGGPHLFRTSAYRSSSLSDAQAEEETRNVVLRLREESAVDYAEFNGIRHAELMPNDLAFTSGLQWNLNLINLPAAWEITTGSSQIVVAVLDTGIRSQADLDANVLSTGYDFVENDGDPTEPLTPLASFHGSHVAGTIAAVGNNNSGMAGVAWGAKILPVRVLGSMGGADAAILNGMLYAAGLPNVSGTVPPQSARVINMSLASIQACPPQYQNVINQVIAAGVVVVAAAGNEGESVTPVTPASCQGVISVAAVDPLAHLASYSNYQPYVTIAAPGGEIGQGIHNSILSTLPVSGAGAPYYRFEQGTSMAAPQIAGVAALMLSANPALTPSQVETILVSNAASVIGMRNTDQGIENVTTTFGLVDAGRAIAAASGTSPSAAIPFPFPAAASFGQIAVAMQMPVFIVNSGGSDLLISGIGCSTGQAGYDCSTGHSWLSVDTDGSCGTISANDSCELTVTVDPAGLSTGQQYIGDVAVITNSGNLNVPVFIQIGEIPTPSSIGPLSVQLWEVDVQTGELTQMIRETEITAVPASSSVNFTFPSVPVGQYVVVAGVDINGDGVFGDASGETQIIGRNPSGILSVADGQTTNIGLEIRNEPDDIVAGF